VKNRSIVLFAILFALAFSLHPVLAESKDKVWNELVDVFSDVEKLGSEGINVTKQIIMLNAALKEFEKGNYGAVETILAEIRELNSNQIAQLGNYRITRFIETYGLAAFYLSIPIVFYLLFPRLYFRVWFRARRKWLVEKK